ncbi:glycosyltransferase [Flavobacterium croceum]|uniref:glycosyltransferase n=1 Tax=Flavobacterium croceum TaxID=370975 RepID=UPI0024A918AD|nr:glycosyltransferase [Flavobacterium croceum]
MKPYYIIITPFFPTKDSFRGPFVYDQVKAINKLGQFETIVLKPKKWYSKEKDYTFEDIKVYRFSTYDLPSCILPGLFDFLSIWSLKRKLKSIGVSVQDVSIVHAHVTGQGVFANGLKKLNNKIKSVLHHHGFDVLSIENGSFRNFKWHRKWVENYGVQICNAIDLHIGVSNKTLTYLQSYSNIKINESYILYNGVDLEKFYQIPNYKKDSQYFTIGCVGNFWPLKDQITLLEAAKILIHENGFQNLRLKMVGTGETLDECLQFVKNHQLGEYVEFTDCLPHKQLIYFYNSLDLFVLPSYWEAFGCVYLEAHACGVPFIGVKEQGISEVVKPAHQSRQLIDKSDITGLKENILYYYQDRNRFPELVLNYNIVNLVEEFIFAVTKKK